MPRRKKSENSIEIENHFHNHPPGKSTLTNVRSQRSAAGIITALWDVVEDPQTRQGERVSALRELHNIHATLSPLKLPTTREAKLHAVIDILSTALGGTPIDVPSIAPASLDVQAEGGDRGSVDSGGSHVDVVLQADSDVPGHSEILVGAVKMAGIEMGTKDRRVALSTMENGSHAQLDVAAVVTKDHAASDFFAIETGPIQTLSPALSEGQGEMVWVKDEDEWTFKPSRSV